MVAIAAATVYLLHVVYQRADLTRDFRDPSAGSGFPQLPRNHVLPAGSRRLSSSIQGQQVGLSGDVDDYTK